MKAVLLWRKSFLLLFFKKEGLSCLLKKGRGLGGVLVARGLLRGSAE
jgi:hypothetical protein